MNRKKYNRLINIIIVGIVLPYHIMSQSVSDVYDKYTSVGQLGLTYQELEEAMNNSSSPHRSKYLEQRKLNLHKMQPIPVCKIPK